MPRSIETKAKRGANELVGELEQMLQKAIAEKGPQALLLFPNTVYYLPIALGLTGKAIEKIGDLTLVLQEARELLQDEVAHTGEQSKAVNISEIGIAALLAAEGIEALRSVDGLSESEAPVSGPIDDLQTRAWGIQLADGRMPGVALILGRAKNNAVAVKLIREFRRQNILCLFSGNVNGRSIINQLGEEGVELCNKTAFLPLGTQTSSAVFALGFAARCAMKLGGLRPGMWPEILEFNKQRTPGFVLALGKPSDLEIAIAAGASNFGFPLILDSEISDAEPKKSNAEWQVVTMPFEALPGEDDLQKADHLIQSSLTIRGLKLTLSSVNLPVAYGPAFEDEPICEADLYLQFGGKDSQAFELVQTAELDDIVDGKIEVTGEAVGSNKQQEPRDLGLIVKVAGRKMQSEFLPVLERQIASFINYASGIQHTGQREKVSIRISDSAASKGISLESLGKILYTRFHENYGAIVEKVEVTFITEPKLYAKWLAKARAAHDLQDKLLAALTDSQVDEFYTCTNCHSFAPNNVCIVSPERSSPCGKCNWLDARADFEMNPSGPHQAIKVGKLLDAKRGIWEGTNNYAKRASHGQVSEVAMYSIMQNPLSACGALECIVMLIPEANGVMVVSQEDTSLTPAGITVSTLSSITAGAQTPGVMGIGKRYLLSPTFISAEGGFKRVVWMSSILKESMAADFKTVCEREGDPALMQKIADERQATSVDELVGWLKDHDHPALAMEPMF